MRLGWKETIRCCGKWDADGNVVTPGLQCDSNTASLTTCEYISTDVTALCSPLFGADGYEMSACVESIPCSLRGSSRVRMDVNDKSQWGGATWYEPRMSEGYRVSMLGLVEISAIFLPVNPGGYPFWAAPISATESGPPIDFERASDIGLENGYGMLSGGERVLRFVGPFRRVAGDGDCTELLHLDWGNLCLKLCWVDRDEVLRARIQLLRLESEWKCGGMDCVGFECVAEIPSDTPSWLREEVRQCLCGCCGCICCTLYSVECGGGCALCAGTGVHAVARISLRIPRTAVG